MFFDGSTSAMIVSDSDISSRGRYEPSPNGPASLCHTNLLVTVTSSVFADQYFLTTLNLVEE